MIECDRGDPTPHPDRVLRSLKRVVERRRSGGADSRGAGSTRSESIEVVTGTGGIFDVHLDGELVFTKSMLGRYPQPDDVLPLLREHLERR